MAIQSQPQEHPLFPGWSKCNAKTRNGGQCQRIGNRKNGRCKLHGGNSTGPPLGNRNGFKHGLYTGEMMKQRKMLSQLLKEAKKATDQL